MIVGPFRALTPQYFEFLKDRYPYQVKGPISGPPHGRARIAEVDEWCTAYFGDPASTRMHEQDGEFIVIHYMVDTDKSWLRRVATWYFQDANQAFEFKMRWG